MKRYDIFYLQSNGRVACFVTPRAAHPIACKPRHDSVGLRHFR